MKSIPELWELIALFEMEPVYVYGEEKEIPWFYNTINFKEGLEAVYLKCITKSIVL